jgi:serine/threonine protein kinase
LHKYGAFSERLIRGYLEEIIKALIYLEKNGQHHGDLCCDKILIDEMGELVLIEHCNMSAYVK